MQSFGHIAEAANDAHKTLYALSDLFGHHRIFFTVTLNDECNFSVCIYANQGNEINLPTPDHTDANGIQDFEL
jgi:hypothetical protein